MITGFEFTHSFMLTLVKVSSWEIGLAYFSSRHIDFKLIPGRPFAMRESISINLINTNHN